MATKRSSNRRSETTENSKDRRKSSRAAKHNGGNTVEFYPNTEQKKVVKPFRPITQKQSDYASSIEKNIVTFGIGPAGSGKSFVAASIAAERLSEKKINKIIVVRPCVETGEHLGFLPGTIEEKIAPYMQPIKEILVQRLGRSTVEYNIKRGIIEMAVLAYMRGSTFEDCFIILDEAQNTTTKQMKMFLTRIGKNCTVVVDGDMEQTDISGVCGLQDAVQRMKSVPQVGVVNFSIDDCVRSGIVKDILIAYARK